LSAFAYAGTEQNAKQLAYASLTAKLNNLANIYRCQYKKSSVEGNNCLGGFFYFDIPIEGVEYQTINTLNSLLGQSAKVNSKSIKTIYTPRISTLHNNIVKGLELSQSTKNTALVKTLWQQHRDYLNIAYLLGVFDIQHTQHLSPAQTNKIKQLQIEKAVKIKDLTDIPSEILALGRVEKAYIHAPTPIGSVEMTPFSEMTRHLIERDYSLRFPSEKISVRGIKNKKSTFKPTCYDQVSKFEILCSNSEPTKTSQPLKNSLLIGTYEVIDSKTMLLHYALRQVENNRLVDHIYMQIPLALISSIRHKPINSLFDQTLHESINEHPDFHVELESTRGTRNILIYGGEDLGLRIRSDTPAFYYLVGHVVREKKQYSYLVEIGSSDKPFVAAISDSQIAQWVDLGEFTVEQPYGVEHLQLVASNTDPSKRLPKTKWDPVDGYHVILGSESDQLLGLKNVRGMQRLCTSPATRGMQRNCGSAVQIIKTKTSPSNVIPEKDLKEDESVLSFSSIKAKN